MKKIYLLTILIFSANLLLADGVMIHFQIEGIAYSHYRTILRNETVAVKRGHQVFFFRTNQYGEYKIDIKIYGGCPSLQPPILDSIEYMNQIEESRGRTIQFFTKNSSVEIANNWKDHTYRNGKMKSNFIETQNLKFRKKKIPKEIEK